MLLCFSLLHANTIIAVMTFDFSKQIQNHSLTLLMVTFVVPNLSQSDYLNLPVTVDELLATKKKGQS